MRDGGPIVPCARGQRQVAKRRRELGLANVAARAIARVKPPRAMAIRGLSTSLASCIIAQLDAGIDVAAPLKMDKARRYKALTLAWPRVTVAVHVIVVVVALPPPTTFLGGHGPWRPT